MIKINFSPIKYPKKLPEVLFYKRPSKYKQEFVAFSTKGDKNWGELILSIINWQYREDYAGKTLGIDFIESNQKHKGLGKAMLNFAKFYSKKNGCNGYILLSADSTLNPEEIPHLFYRKFGFESYNKKNNKKMDRFIKEGKKATKKDFSTMLMYYPRKEKTNLFKKLKSWILSYQ